MPNYRQIARRQARRQGLDPRVFVRQIQQESGFNPSARSPAGALGIAQIMPGTARSWGVDPLRPRQALAAAARHMADYVRQFGSYENALRAYNAGPGAVEASKGYAETNNYVRSILGDLNPRPLGTGGDAGPSGGGPRSLPEGSGNALALLSALGAAQASEGTASAGVPLPAHAAGPVLAGQVPQSSGGPAASKPDMTALMAAVQTVGGGIDRAGLPGGGQLGGGGGNGRVVLGPGADRAGVQTKPYVLDFARRISAISGRKVRIGTGTKHSQYTVNGNVSDHWDGDAGDVPASGRRLIELGQAALIAAGMPERQARKQTGGLYNVNGAQIIFNTQEGGDHSGHLHFRPPPRRRRR